MKMRGIDDEYCRKIIVDYLKQFGKAKRSDLAKVLLDKLPDVLNKEQKVNKIRNNLQKPRADDMIEAEGGMWKLIENRKDD
jgi:ATP-dependent DNA helicase RecG